MREKEKKKRKKKKERERERREDVGVWSGVFALSPPFGFFNWTLTVTKGTDWTGRTEEEVVTPKVQLSFSNSMLCVKTSIWFFLNFLFKKKKKKERKEKKWTGMIFKVPRKSRRVRPRMYHINRNQRNQGCRASTMHWLSLCLSLVVFFLLKSCPRVSWKFGPDDRDMVSFALCHHQSPCSSQ